MCYAEADNDYKDNYQIPLVIYLYIFLKRTSKFSI